MAFNLGKWLRPRSRTADATKKKPVSRWQAVTIVPAIQGGCEQAHALAGKPFLVNEAPELPLPGCDAARCNCRFSRREDRREGPRRAADDGLTTTFVFDNDRRKRKSGRRKDDR